MHRVGFEPTISMFERTKTVHAPDSATTVIGHSLRYIQNTCSRLHLLSDNQCTSITCILMIPCLWNCSKRTKTLLSYTDNAHNLVRLIENNYLNRNKRHPTTFSNLRPDVPSYKKSSCPCEARPTETTFRM
jgi:hypothetical protein